MVFWLFTVLHDSNIKQMVIAEIQNLCCTRNVWIILLFLFAFIIFVFYKLLLILYCKYRCKAVGSVPRVDDACVDLIRDKILVKVEPANLEDFKGQYKYFLHYEFTKKNKNYEK